MDTLAVIDSETTGLSPVTGGWATEVTVVIVDDGIIIDRAQSLTRRCAPNSPFIES